MTPRNLTHAARVLAHHDEQRSSIEAIATSLGTLPPALRERVAQTAALIEHARAEQTHRLLILLCQLAYAEGAAQCARQMAQRQPTKETV